MNFVLIILLLIPYTSFTQDNIELPDIKLTIRDQSIINTISTEDALLEDRNPKFQEVYLEELNNTEIQDTSFLAAYSQNRYFRYSSFKFLYGSYNSTFIDFISQDVINDFFYKVTYEGHYRNNAGFKETIFPNSTQNSNLLEIDFSYTKSDLIFDINLLYKQLQVNFNNISQRMHYIPIDIKMKYWFNDYSHIRMGASIGTSFLSLKDLKLITLKETIILDSKFDFSYSMNPNEKSYINFDINYMINYYGKNSNIKIINTGCFGVASDLNLGKGFILNLGAKLIIPSIDKVYGWPELRLAYNYLNIFMMDIKMTGDFDFYNANSSSKEQQFYSINPSPEAKWRYESSIMIKPLSYFWIGTSIAYNQYRSKRIYEYNSLGNLYQFISISRINLLETGITAAIEISKIFQLKMTYTYQNIPKDWLLFSPHKIDLNIGIGYRPIGFWFETSFLYYAPRNLLIHNKAPLIALWNISITQKVHKVISLSLDINNILNQNIQFLEGTYYGGIQAYGGIQFSF